MKMPRRRSSCVGAVFVVLALAALAARARLTTRLLKRLRDLGVEVEVKVA